MQSRVQHKTRYIALIGSVVILTALWLGGCSQKQVAMTADNQPTSKSLLEMTTAQQAIESRSVESSSAGQTVETDAQNATTEKTSASAETTVTTAAESTTIEATEAPTNTARTTEAETSGEMKMQETLLSERFPELCLGDDIDALLTNLDSAAYSYRVITNYRLVPQSGLSGFNDSVQPFVVYRDAPLTVERVKWLQEQLKIAGYYTLIDGSYGPDCKAQLAAFCSQQLNREVEYFNSDIEQALLDYNANRMAGDIDDYLVYASKEINLRSTDVPSRLVDISVAHSANVEQIEAKTNEYLIKMFDAANADGIALRVVSGYRSFQYQIGLFDRYMQRSGFAQANRYSALPGQSEHQTGYVVDVDDGTNRHTVKQSFDQTPAFQWLDAHAHEYGFILSYPKGKEDITGYMYEPWHYRFVGSPEVAGEIKRRDITLEQYVKQLKD